MDDKTKDFINKARKVHGDKYDYSRVQYTKSKEEVEIICNNCGPFRMRASNHLNGGNCPNCKRWNTEKFIKKSKELYGGDRFDYSLAVYSKFREKVVLICNKPGHGQFSQMAQNHIQKPEHEPCPDCRKDKRKQRELDFIKESERVHGKGRYDYSEVSFQNLKSDCKVILTCNNCGNRWSRNLYSHLKGFSCPSCNYYTTESFIERSKEIHGDKFGYDKFKYEAMRVPATFWCNHHKGYFQQTPASHLKGGCEVCRKKEMAGPQYSTEEWIRKAQEVHGDRYDYSKAVYNGSSQDVDVFCNVHQLWFKQNPSRHLQGMSSCRKCFKEKQGGWGRTGIYRTTKPSGIYLMRMSKDDDSWLKIGLSRDIKRRTVDMKREIEGADVGVLAYYEGPARECYEMENGLLHRYNLLRRCEDDWEWAGKSECFCESQLDKILCAMDERADYLTGVFRTI